MPSQPRRNCLPPFFALRLTACQLLTACLVAVLPVGLVACGDREAGGEAVSQVRPLKVLTSSFAAAGPPELTESFTGVVVPHRTSSLAAKALGRVDAVLADIGDRVEAGQLLIQLDEEQLAAELQVAEANLSASRNRLEELESGPRQQDIKQAEARVAEVGANLKLAEANFERARSLRSSSAISAQELDEQRFAVEATRAQLDSAEKQLDLLREGTRSEELAAQRNAVKSLEAAIERIKVRQREQQVRAPYAGQIQQRLVDEGDVISAGTPLLEIVESAELEVEVGLPVGLAGELEPSTVSIVAAQASGPGQELPAELIRMSPGLDPATRTRKCIFRLRPSAAEHVVIGDAVDVFVRRPTGRSSGEPESGRSRSIWVPTEALSAGPRGLWNVFVVVDAAEGANAMEQVVESRPIELLRAHGRWSEVRGPIDPEEQLVVTGVHRIVSGQRVVAVAADGDVGLQEAGKDAESMVARE